MESIELTKNQLLDFLFNKEQLGIGTNGILCEFSSTTLIKIYYKKIIDTYLSKDPSELDEEIQSQKEVQKMIEELPYLDFSSLEKETQSELQQEFGLGDKPKNSFYSKGDEIEQKKLQYLSDIGLLKGIVTYDDYKIGILMQYYKDYSRLTKFQENISPSELEFVMEKVQTELQSMMIEGLYPMDLKEDHILVRPKDFDIKIVDLDDSETRFEDEAYVLAHPYIKNECIESYKKIKKRLLKNHKIIVE